MNITNYTLHANISVPCRVVQASDLHDRCPADVVTALKQQKPDMIAVTGDLFNHLDTARHALAFLKAAAAIAPTFYTTGNHEKLHEGDATRIRETGVTLLLDEAVSFRGMSVGGLCSGFGRKRQGNFRATPPPNQRFLRHLAAQKGFKLLLCHHPEYYPTYIRPLGIDLTLSGHAHGGQWCLLGHPLFAPGQGFFPRFAGGFYENRLVVSRGLSNTLPVPRIGNPPELCIITLIPCS